MIYLESYGAIWKLTARAYQRFLRSVAKGEPWDLDDYGKRVADNPIPVTDLDGDKAEELLKEYHQYKR